MAAIVRNAEAGTNAGAASAAKSAANAQDRLARTTRAIDAVVAMQAAARSAATAGRLSRLTDPNHAGKLLPFVPNGLAKNGLQVDSLVPKNLKKPKPGENAGLWVGANLPTQTSSKGGGKNVTIVQTTSQALLNWKTFNVGKKTTLTFDQSAGGLDESKWVAFNKINDPSGRPSQILGSIKAGGQVYVINQNGIIFGGSGQVNVHTLVASGLLINDNLIASGLLNNPGAQFLFNNERVDDIKSALLANENAPLSQLIDPRSPPEIEANVTITNRAASGTTTSTVDYHLAEGTDYTLVTDKDRNTTVVLTATGKAKTQGTNQPGVTVVANSIVATYPALSGNIVVQAGASLSSPTSAASVGGRIFLVGANVENGGTISTPDGQTILAAGLQVGINGHVGANGQNDPSLRGLDVYVGAIAEPGTKESTYAGTASNKGLIEAPEADVMIAGKDVRQLGAIDSGTNVSLNGRIDLLANYDAVTNTTYQATDTSSVPFYYKSTGTVTFGKESVSQILPDVASPDSVIGDTLPLLSQVNVQGLVVHLDDGAMVLAPNANVQMNAGAWFYTQQVDGSGTPTSQSSTFEYPGGQIYADTGALIDVAGTTAAAAPISENIVTVQLRGAELANSPLQRAGNLRAVDLTVDLRNTGTLGDGTTWVGTPLGDLTGFQGLIQRTAAELTTAGGTVNLNAGSSVVLQKGATVDVSGGWVKYGAGMVQTTRVVSGGELIDIADASPDIVYDGIYNPQFVESHAKYGVSATFDNPLSLSGAHFENSYIAGQNGGAIAITAPSMAIDGTLTGNTTAGTRQLRDSSQKTQLPTPSSLSLAFHSQAFSTTPPTYPTISPTPPTVVFADTSNQAPVDAFGLDALGNPLPLRSDRTGKVVLSTDLVNSGGFGTLNVENNDGKIIVRGNAALDAGPGGSITFSAANLDIAGDVVAPGGTLNFTVYDISPWQASILLSDKNQNDDNSITLPAPDPDRGLFTLAAGANLSTAGTLVDDAFSSANPLANPIAQNGGTISINTYDASLEAGSTIDVSGGATRSSNGKVSYGNAGKIVIEAGHDPGTSPNLSAVMGGRLKLASTLKGYSGTTTGGSLTIQAPLIRIGSTPVTSAEFGVTPEFFDQGGFSTFSLIGLASPPLRPSPFSSESSFTLAGALNPILPNHFLPGLVIDDDTIISPAVKSLIALPIVAGSDSFSLQQALLQPSLRPAISLSFSAANGVTDPFSNQILTRGDLKFGEGAEVDAGPLGKVSLSGETVSVLGSVDAPGGNITVTGGSSYRDIVNGTLNLTPANARATVYFGPNSVLSAAGEMVLKPDPYGRRIGTVLSGGNISVSGNILAEAGSVMNVSGATGILDLPPTELGRGLSAASVVPVGSGINSPLYSLSSAATEVDSNGGLISLKGSQELFVDSTLLGAAGGPTAVGGGLEISSGLFYQNPQQIPNPKDINLVVKQSGPTFTPPDLKPGRDGVVKPGRDGVGEVARDATGAPIAARGYFTADQFLDGGFDSLSLGGLNSVGVGLGGTVSFLGPVDITAGQKISVAARVAGGLGGVIYANDKVDLTAPYVTLGGPFLDPSRPGDTNLTSTYLVGGQPYYFRPQDGPGQLIVHAKLIDVGDLELRNIGSTSLIADGGDIRGDGTFVMAGSLYLRAGQIYPVTDATFTIAVYDYTTAEDKKKGKFHKGSIEIVASGSRQLPLSAAGVLNIDATKIRQDGVLRAPLGTINLGWNGTGTAPFNLTAGERVPVTSRLVLGPDSETSVSAVDPNTDQDLTIPYGIVANGTNWIDPSGIDITAGGLPSKNISLSAGNVITRPGSLIDIAGGGNLFAYRFVPGDDGTNDILASTTSFAVIPGYESDFAPYSTFNQTDAAQSTFDPTFIATDPRNPGYTNNQIHVGDRVFLGASSGLAAGYYTLLPARYALLPGAALVTPAGGTARSAVAMPDGSTIVPGLKFNDLDSSRVLPGQYTSFEVDSASVVAQRAEYDDFFANQFLKKSARTLGVNIPRLPQDSGHLVFNAITGMDLLGNVSSMPAVHGIGAYIDISSPANIEIVGSDTATNNDKHHAGELVLEASQLSSFGAESLLIGGIRSDTSTADTDVTVITDNLTVDNAGFPLSGPEVILVANDHLTLAPHAEVEQSGSMIADAQQLTVVGDGALLRVSSDSSAKTNRTGVTGATTAGLTVGHGAEISGKSLVLDSSYATSLSPEANLDSDFVSLDSGQISLALKNPGALQPTVGLVLARHALQDLQGVESLSLLSYSSIDIYGTGRLAVAGDLSLHAGEIRGYDSSGGTVALSADTILLDNRAHGTRPLGDGSLVGTLDLNAKHIQLGNGKLNVEQYVNLDLNASSDLVLGGHGRLKTAGNLTARTPSVLTVASAVQSIQAAGTLQMLNPAKGASTDALSGLGASLSLQGASVVVDSNILLPSGLLSIDATTGDLTVGGRLDVGSAGETFFDQTRYPDGGKVTLTADQGSVDISAGAVVSVASSPVEGNAGSLSINAPEQSATIAGTLLGRGGKNGKNGTFSVDVASLGQFSKLGTLLDAGSFTESRSFRIRSGDVTITGKTVSHHFDLSTDAGSIVVAGTIDASGPTGGSIDLSANGNLTLLTGSLLTAAGADFNSAGKGGAISLEAGADSNGTYANAATLNADGTYSGSGVLDIQDGSEIDLGVTSNTPASASLGQFTGTLHLRAPRTTAGTEVQVDPLNGVINGASSVIVEGYKIYNLNPTNTPDAAGTISTAIKNQVQNDAIKLIGSLGTPTTPGTDAVGYAAMLARLLGPDDGGFGSVLTIRPGAELIDPSGNITLGSSSTSATNDWNLQTYRFGSKSVPGILTMRARGNLIFLNALSDGFDVASVINAYTAPLLPANPLLPMNAQSWSYRLVAGADLSAADFQRVDPLADLEAGSGSLLLGKNFYPGQTTAGANSTTSTAVTGRYQVIRTGSGDIDIAAGRDIQLLNQFATIYTAGTLIDPTDGGAFSFDVPKSDASALAIQTLGKSQQLTPYPAQYSLGGGDVNLFAQADIAHYTTNTLGIQVDDSERELPDNWLDRRGYVDPATGEFGKSKFGDIASTTWWVDFSNFFEGVGALGGGDVSLTAGNDVKNVDAVAPTNARMPKGVPNASAMIELGGGDVSIQAGNDINGGVYYVERGTGSLMAGADILTNSTRSPSATILQNAAPLDPSTWLPTTLFLGKGSFNVEARGNVLLGPVANVFLLPQGINNSNYYKTYFSTYAPTDSVNVTSLGGSVNLGEDSIGQGSSDPLLYTWINNTLVWVNGPLNTGASNTEPWLRLAESSVVAFRTVSSILPPTLDVTAFAGDINVIGNLTLSPAPRGNVDLLAAGSINGLQDQGFDTAIPTDRAWVASQIDLSDANPASIPGIATPFAYQTLAGTANNTTRSSDLLDLTFIDNLFAETGSTIGAAGTIETKQALHTPGLLHTGDPNPVDLYAAAGDISGLTLFSGKPARIISGEDITDIAFYVQNLESSDVTVVSAARDIIAYDANSPLRAAANAPGNDVFNRGEPLSGDIQISGLGTLEVLAGRNLDLGTGGTNLDGTGTGITSIGNGRDPYLPFAGAGIIAGAGIGLSTGLAGSSLDFPSFMNDFLATPTGISDLVEALGFTNIPDAASGNALTNTLSGLTTEQQAAVALDAFYLLLRDAGRAHIATGASYDPGFAAIASLFGTGKLHGDITTQARDIRTKNGGDIDLFAPGGQLTLASSVLGNTLAPPGIVTESGGNISIFTDEDVDLGIGRIFSLEGGNEIIWSSDGNIAAGASAKTVKSAPPTRVLLDPQSADVQTDLSGLATGGGIGVLATVAGVPPGTVDLIAPNGTVDAGDAGIRATGSVNIAAAHVLNADNIAAPSVAGVPTSAPAAAPNTAGLTAASSSAGASNSATTQIANLSHNAPPAQDQPSDVSADLLDFGSDDGTSDDPSGASVAPESSSNPAANPPAPGQQAEPTPTPSKGKKDAGDDDADRVSSNE